MQRWTARTYGTTFLALILATSFAQGQIVPGYTVEDYASVNGPVEMSFADSGMLYVGRDLSASGGVPLSPTIIHSIGVGGAPVMEYGPVISDPDAVYYDQTGGISGTPGSVLVAGRNQDGVTGFLTSILPDQTTVDLFNWSNDVGNPNSLKVDSMGRLLIADNDGQVYTYTSGGSPNLLFSLSDANGSLTLDQSDNIYTAALDGVIRIHDSAGNLIDDMFYTGLGTGISTPIEIGPGDSLWGDDLYAIDRGTGELLRIDASGSGTVIGTGFADGGRMVADLAFGPDGAMYVSVHNENRILRIIPEPSVLVLFGLASLVALRRK